MLIRGLVLAFVAIRLVVPKQSLFLLLYLLYRSRTSLNSSIYRLFRLYSFTFLFLGLVILRLVAIED